MQNLINMLSAFFTFLFTQLGNVANFFVTNTLGIIMLAIVLLYIVVDVVITFLKKGK